MSGIVAGIGEHGAAGGINLRVWVGWSAANRAGQATLCPCAWPCVDISDGQAGRGEGHDMGHVGRWARGQAQMDGAFELVKQRSEEVMVGGLGRATEPQGKAEVSLPALEAPYSRKNTVA